MNQIISLLLAIVQIGKFCEADTHLFDLNIHPHEEDIYESLSSEYSDVYETLVERSSYWSNYVISTVDVDGCLNQIDEYLPRKTSQFGQLPTGAK